MPKKSAMLYLLCSRFLLFPMILLVACSLAITGYAQSIQGSVIGTVHDAAGAVVSGATVTLTNLSEGTMRTTVSGATGDYQFIDTKAGRYTVEVTANGFEKWAATNLILAARQQFRVDASLPVGSVQQEVNVSADTLSAINTEDPTISGVYNATDVANLAREYSRQRGRHQRSQHRRHPSWRAGGSWQLFPAGWTSVPDRGSGGWHHRARLRTATRPLRMPSLPANRSPSFAQTAP